MPRGCEGGGGLAVPFGVDEFVGLGRAFVGVGAEVVALGLDQVAGQAFAAEGVVVGERRAKGGQADAVVDAELDDASPGILTVGDGLAEAGIDEEVGQPGVTTRVGPRRGGRRDRAGQTACRRAALTLRQSQATTPHHPRRARSRVVAPGSAVLTAWQGLLSTSRG
jgi:hypothetical protein